MLSIGLQSKSFCSSLQSNTASVLFITGLILIVTGLWQLKLETSFSYVPGLELANTCVVTPDRKHLLPPPPLEITPVERMGVP